MSAFFEKMATARIRLLLYYDDTIKNDEDGMQHSQPVSRMVRLFSSLSCQKLLNHLYSGIPIDREKYEIKLR